MGGEGPEMAEGVLHRAVAVAPEHVLRGHGDGGAGFGCLLDGLVAVLGVDMHSDGRRAERFGMAGLAAAPLGEVVGDHDDGVTDFDLGVHEFARAVGRVHAADLLGSEGLLVEIDCLGGAVDAKVGGDGVEAVGDGLGHELSPGRGFVSPATRGAWLIGQGSRDQVVLESENGREWVDTRGHMLICKIRTCARDSSGCADYCESMYGSAN